jgi:hypothetical protein
MESIGGKWRRFFLVDHRDALKEDIMVNCRKSWKNHLNLEMLIYFVYEKIKYYLLNFYNNLSFRCGL